MLKERIKYTDFDGNAREEDFYFNLTKAELAELDVTIGGMDNVIKTIISTTNNAKIVEIMKDIILRAHGEKSLDGRRFVKNQEIRDSFAATEAYSELFMKLANDADAAAKFFNGIIPAMPT